MNVSAIVVPYDSGLADVRMGRGPQRLLEAALEPRLTRAGHTLAVDPVRASGQFPSEIATTFDLCARVAGRVDRCLRAHEFPLVLSGNCSISVGTVAGCGCQTTGVVWFDARGESNSPETTSSGFLDGMGIGIITGQCWRRNARSPRPLTWPRSSWRDNWLGRSAGDIVRRTICASRKCFRPSTSTPPANPAA